MQATQQTTGVASTGRTTRAGLAAVAGGGDGTAVGVAPVALPDQGTVEKVSEEARVVSHYLRLFSDLAMESERGGRSQVLRESIATVMEDLADRCARVSSAVDDVAVDISVTRSGLAAHGITV